MLDGELIVVVDGIQEFDLLGQRIHPAKSRVEMLAEKWPAAFVAFDVLAVGDEVADGAAVRRAPRAARGADPGGTDAGPADADDATTARAPAAG